MLQEFCVEMMASDCLFGRADIAKPGLTKRDLGIIKVRHASSRPSLLGQDPK